MFPEDNTTYTRRHNKLLSSAVDFLPSKSRVAYHCFGVLHLIQALHSPPGSVPTRTRSRCSAGRESESSLTALATWARVRCRNKLSPSEYPQRKSRKSTTVCKSFALRNHEEDEARQRCWCGLCCHHGTLYALKKLIGWIRKVKQSDPLHECSFFRVQFKHVEDAPLREWSACVRYPSTMHGRHLHAPRSSDPDLHCIPMAGQIGYVAVCHCLPAPGASTGCRIDVCASSDVIHDVIHDTTLSPPRVTTTKTTQPQTNSRAPSAYADVLS